VLATIADLSVIEAEVEVDETDIPSIELGQPAVVTIDALPDEEFRGVVTEIGNSPIQAGGQGAGTQATTFKVVVTLDDEIPNVRPGFTSTADITTALRTASLSIPIQAATVREVVVDAAGQVVRADPDGPGRRGVSSGVSASELPPGGSEDELEGVFVARQGRAVFVPVKTGIAGERYFEALDGIVEGDLIITGPFSEVRNLNDGDAIRVISGASSAEAGEGGFFGSLRRARTGAARR
jgi:HlyD family secretion protein